MSNIFINFKHNSKLYLMKLFKRNKAIIDPLVKEYPFIKYAIEAHKNVNQMYANDLPYEYHLRLAAAYAELYCKLIPDVDWFNVYGGVWCHDVIEDTRQTYNDVKKNTNETIAEYSYALANEKGKNRAERANKKYYDGIKNYKHATFIKLCDRMANVSYSRDHNERMFNMYREEYDEFFDKLYDGRYNEMWTALKTMLD